MTAPLREVMPPRVCAGFGGACTTPLSIYNHDSVCGACSGKRAEAIANQQYVVKEGLSTHCRNGHLYTLTNTYWAKRGRVCRECARVREFARRPVEAQW